MKIAALCLGAIAVTTGIRAANYPNYRITDLGTPSGAFVVSGTGARPLSAAGDVLWMFDTDAYLWKSDSESSIDITTSGTGKHITTNALDVNASGHVAGCSKRATYFVACDRLRKGDKTCKVGTLAQSTP